MSSWEGWSDPYAPQAQPEKPKGPPTAVLGPPTDGYGFVVSEEYYDKIDERVSFAKVAVVQAESGKRISNFREGPYNKKFFQSPINDSDAFAHVGYWMAVAGMATGNRELIGAASDFVESAETWSTPFLRMKTGGIAKIYRGGLAALRKNAGSALSNQTVKYVAGIFTAQGNPAMTKAARERAEQQDPFQSASDALTKTLTTKPKLKRIPWWVYGIAGTIGILAVATILRPYASVASKKKGQNGRN